MEPPSSNIHLDIQTVSKVAPLPDEADLREWVRLALSSCSPKPNTQYELCIRIVDEDESAELNGTYRNKPYPTNVLSFQADNLPTPDYELLGDLAICAPVLAQEAKTQHKTIKAHWAHIVIHGTLHLLGFDHQNDDDAKEMETLEINLLKQIGFANPYGEMIES